jgi:DNA-binding NarL/FixJ family response regulator
VGKNATQSKEEALREAIEKVRAEFPDFEPEFDKFYFSMSDHSTEPDIKTEEDKSITSTERECVIISLCACGVPCRYHG